MGSKDGEKKVTAGFAATKGLATSRAVLNTLEWNQGAHSLILERPI